MATKKIRLAPDAAPHAVFDIARRTLEDQGYQWKPLDRSTAEAHEGGKEGKSKLFSLRLRMSLRIEDDALVLKSGSSGLGLVGATEHPAAFCGHIEQAQQMRQAREIHATGSGARLNPVALCTPAPVRSFRCLAALTSCH